MISIICMNAIPGMAKTAPSKPQLTMKDPKLKPILAYQGKQSHQRVSSQATKLEQDEKDEDKLNEHPGRSAH